MAINHADSSAALAQLKAQIETYLQQPDGDTRIADRVGTLLRVVGQCIADRACAAETEEGYLAGFSIWATGRRTEEQGTSFPGEASWRNAFVDPDPRLMEAWGREKGERLCTEQEWDQTDLKVLVARYDEQY